MTTSNAVFDSFWRRRRIPAQLVIQITDRCNARCPQCGMRVTAPFKRSSLGLKAIFRMLDHAARHKVQAVSFTGGEPLLRIDDLVAMIRYAGNIGIPYIRTGTNGFVFRNPDSPAFRDRVRRLADRLADTALRNFWISVDSADPVTHEQMRGFEGVVRGIARALPVFHRRGLFPSANLGLNRNMGGDLTRCYTRQRHQSETTYLQGFYRRYKLALARFYAHVTDLGFTMVNTCYPMSITPAEVADGLNPVYAATAEEDIVRFSPGEKQMLFQALLDTIPRYRSRIRIFSPLCSLKALVEQYRRHGVRPYACRGGIDFFFVDCQDGGTYPCGYRGNENLGPFWEVDLDHRWSGNPVRGCLRCDWECFRDPSELCGPLLEGLTAPLQLAGRLQRRPRDLAIWLRDLRYYRACRLFDGRKPMDHRRLRAFKKYSPAA